MHILWSQHYPSTKGEGHIPLSHLQHPLELTREEHVECLNCYFFWCRTCVLVYHDKIRLHRSLSATVKNSDGSILVLNEMRDRLLREPPVLSIERGPCCVFKHGISSSARPSTVVPPRPTSILSPSTEPVDAPDPLDDDDRDEFLPTTRKQDIMAERRRISKLNGDQSSCNFLYSYHSNPDEFPHKGDLRVERPKDILAANNANQARKNKQKRNNPNATHKPPIVIIPLRVCS